MVSSLNIHVLNTNSLKQLATEPNSNEYAIDAHNRSIRVIEDLSHFPKLCTLDVSFNSLTSLGQLNTAKELRELKIYNNKLTSFAGINQNTKLEVLYIQENQLSALTEDLLPLGKLKVLWLYGNLIPRIENLFNCRNLVHLDLSRNRLTGTVAKGLETLTHLEFLNVNDNHFISIGNMSHLVHLEELAIGKNQLMSLQGVLPSNLLVLRLHENRIQDLSSLSPTLLKLNELYLQGNRIEDINVLSTKTPELESLNISNNKIQSINSFKCFAGTTQHESTLRDLWLQGNPLTQSQSYIPDLLQLLPSLQTIDNIADIALKNHSQRERSTTQLDSNLSPRPISGVGNRSRPTTPLYPQRSVSQSLSNGSDNSGSQLPVFINPSQRTPKAFQKLVPIEELTKAQEDIKNRLKQMKGVLHGYKSEKNIQTGKATSVITYDSRDEDITSSKMETKSNNSHHQDKKSLTSKRLKKNVHRCDFGTNPNDSYIQSEKSGQPSLTKVPIKVVSSKRYFTNSHTQTPRSELAQLSLNRENQVNEELATKNDNHNSVNPANDIVLKELEIAREEHRLHTARVIESEMLQHLQLYAEFNTVNNQINNEMNNDGDMRMEADVDNNEKRILMNVEQLESYKKSITMAKDNCINETPRKKDTETTSSHYQPVKLHTRYGYQQFRIPSHHGRRMQM